MGPVHLDILGFITCRKFLASLNLVILLNLLQFGPTDLLHPTAAPNFKTFKVFIIYFPKCPSFSTI